MRTGRSILFLGMLLAAVTGCLAASKQDAISGPFESTSGKFAVTEDIRNLPGKAAETQEEKQEEKRERPLLRTPRNLINSGAKAQVTAAVQGTAGPAAATTAGVGFNGLGNGVGGFVVNSAPPDPS